MTQKTGYPSIDRPWLKYYSDEAINAPLPECTMYEYIWQNNKDYLSDIALRYYGAKISYGQLFDNIKRAAAAFAAMGVKAGDIVTIMSMHTPETIVAIYGLNYLGAVANMVYMTLSPKEIVGTLRNTESKLLLILDAAVEKLDEIKSEITVPVVVLGVSDSMPVAMKLGYKLKAKPPKHDYMTWKTFLAGGAASALSEPAHDHATPAVIVYTSGTTGEPKGVVLSSYNINAVAVQCAVSGKEYRRGETFFDNIPQFFGFGISMAHLALLTGIELILWMDISPEGIAKGLAKTKPNRYAGGPLVVEPFMRYCVGDLSHIKEFTGGGEALAQEKEEALNAFLKAHQSPAKYTTGYGMSEVVSVVCAQQNHIYRLGTVGLPLPKVNIRIVEPESGQELSYGEIGEMCFCAPNMMIGYYRNPSETDKIIKVDKSGRRWLHTGDLGFIDEDGYVHFVGRIKRIYVTTGKDGKTINKIFPQRLEEFLETQAMVKACGVIVIPDSIRVNAPVTFVTLEDAAINRESAIQTLTRSIEGELPDHLWPAAIHILETMPMTQSGKIDYRALEALAEEQEYKH